MKNDHLGFISESGWEPYGAWRDIRERTLFYNVDGLVGLFGISGDGESDELEIYDGCTYEWSEHHRSWVYHVNVVEGGRGRFYRFLEGILGDRALDVYKAYMRCSRHKRILDNSTRLDLLRPYRLLEYHKLDASLQST